MFFEHPLSHFKDKRRYEVRSVEHKELTVVVDVIRSHSNGKINNNQSRSGW